MADPLGASTERFKGPIWSDGVQNDVRSLRIGRAKSACVVMSSSREEVVGSSERIQNVTPEPAFRDAERRLFTEQSGASRPRVGLRA
jgi:hypothetical protein